MNDEDIILYITLCAWISIYFYMNYVSVNFDSFLSSSNAIVIINNTIKFTWVSFLIYIFYWIIDFSFYKTKNEENKSDIPILQCIFCGLYAFLLIICMNTIPDNNVISGWWFFGIGFIGVIFGFIYYFKYLEELGLAFISDQTSDNNDSIPQHHFIKVFWPILRFIINKDDKPDDKPDVKQTEGLIPESNSLKAKDIKNFDNEKLLYAISIYAKKFVDVVIN